ncbi:hypothetical protein AgCh_006163 [Apium graveolens]
MRRTSHDIAIGLDYDALNNKKKDIGGKKDKSHIDHRQWMLKIYDSKKTGEVALKGARKGSLFVADLESANEDGICYFYTKASVEQRKLWHKKLSHLNFKAINTLVKKELVKDMTNLEFAQDEICGAFQKGKMKRSSHKSKTGYSLERTAYKVYMIKQKKIMENTYVTFDDDKYLGLECLDENEVEALKFENINIDSDSDDEAKVNTNHRVDEESTEKVNHENGSSYQTPEFDSTNLGGERGENSGSHANDEEEEAENTSQKTQTRK